MQLIHTNDYHEACRLRDAGYEPIECAFGQYGSVLGAHNLDHHGTESHREGVAIRACRDLYGARADDQRFVVTGTADADAVLAIVALSAAVPAEQIPTEFYELVDRHDVDPIGLDLLDSPEGEDLAWFNQRPHLTQSEKGFREAIGHMVRLLEDGIDAKTRKNVRSSDKARRRKAMDGVLSRRAQDGMELPIPESVEGLPVLRGEMAEAEAARVLVVKSTVWGFDQWYRLAPVVVSYAARMAKVTVGCPDIDTAERMFGPGGLKRVWKAMGRGWGGRETIGGSPRGQRLAVSDTHTTAETALKLLR